MNKLASALVLVFALTLAATIGLRMNSEAMTVAIGVVFGAAVGLPASLLIASFIRADQPAPARATVVREAPRETAPMHQMMPQMQQQPQPPVIIVNPASSMQPGWPPYGMNMPPAIPPPNAKPRRSARVVGEESEEEKGW